MANKMLYPRNTLTRQVIDLSGMWKFSFDFAENGEENGYPTQGLKDYIEIPVPASYNDFFTDKKYKEYCGDVWYEQEFYADKSWQDKDVDIRFFAAIHKATVWFNGEKVAYHNGGFTPFTININKLLKYDGVNKIVVKLNNVLDNTTLPSGEYKVLKDGRKISNPYFDFFNYGGLIRPVKLVITPKSSVVDVTLNHVLTNTGSITYYDVEHVGQGEVLVEVYDQNQEKVAFSKGAKGTLEILNTKLWEVRNAYLYHFVFKLIQGEKLLDEYYLDCGIRTVSVKGNRVLINNKPVYFKGFGKHEDADFTGRGYNLACAKRDFELMKWCGANSFRTSHYPYSEEILQLAESEGFLVIDELAAVGMLKSTRNAVDAANKDLKIESYFEQEVVKKYTLPNHLEALRELVARDKNYACVVMWSLFNEPDAVSSDDCIPYFEQVFNLCKELDIQQRPRSFAHIIASSPTKSKVSYLCDVIMLNRYYGWYIMGGAELDDAMLALDAELSEWDQKGKPVMFTEYGTDTYMGLTKLPSVMWTENYQVEYFEKYHEVFDKHPSIIGEQVWNFADFQTTEGIIRADGNKKGIFTRSRQPKMAAFELRRRWLSLPTDYKGDMK